MEKLTILLACANSERSPLEAVKKERETLMDIFDRVVNQESNVLQYKEEASFEVETLVNAIRLYEKTLHAFHFAGHANGTALKLDDESAHGEGIARVLKHAPKLKLVFLNGCATKGHVARLLDAGVAAVIATSAEIPDRIAQLFSEYFYQAFVSDKRSLLAAFEHAKENIQVIEKNEILDARDIDDSFTENATEAMPWGIYINPLYEQEQVKSWKIGQIFDFNLAPDPDSEFDRNPYIVGSAIKDPEGFFDRSELLAKLQNIQQGKICIFGIRRIGKTSLLYQIYHAYQVVNQRIPLMINLQGLKDEAEMGEYLYREIKNRAFKGNPIVAGFSQAYQTADFIKTLSNWSDFCTDNQLESVLLIDEAEQLRSLSTASLNKFIQLLNVPGGTLSTIITGSRALRELCIDDERFLFGFQHINLDVFPVQDSEDLLTQNGTVRVSAKNATAIIHASGNHPYFTQYIASGLYDRGRLLELSNKPEVFTLKDDIRSVMEDEFNRLSEMEQMVMHLLTFHTPIDIDALNKKVPLVRVQLEATLLELSELSFVTFQNKQYTLGNIFWQKYLEIPPPQQTSTPPSTPPSPSPPKRPSMPTTTSTTTSTTIFISYHSDDEKIYQKLKIHLNPRTLAISDSNSLPLGDDILDSLQAEIDQTQTILLLLSAVYLADDPKFQEREAIKALKAKGKKVIPILVSACNWEEEFGSVVILPRSRQPISAVDNLDQVLTDIAREIKQLL